MHYFLYIKLWTKQIGKLLIVMLLFMMDVHLHYIISYHIPNGSISIKENAWNIPSAIQLPMKLPN